MPSINIYYEGQQLRSYELEGERMTIGRRPDNDIVIDDVAVSGQHAVIHVSPDPIFREQNHVEIEDSGSTNGTWVNGLEVQRKKLVHGDVVRMGRHELHYRDEQVAGLEQTAIYIADDLT